MRSAPLHGVVMTAVLALVLGACATHAPSPRAGSQASSGPPAEVRVEFVAPEHFTDIGEKFPGSTKRRDSNLDELRQHIEERAQRVLAEGQSLRVSITDIDMAGRTEPWHPRLWDTRIVRDIYSPRIALRFELADAQGTVLGTGERSLHDSAFMSRGRGGYINDPLRYEKALLDDWIEREFGAARRG